MVVGFTGWSTLIPIAMQRRRIGMMVTQTTRANLETLCDYLVAGRLKPHIEHRFSFDEMPQAMSLLESGRARGKIVVSR
ncbi:MAG: zinc-binding dehydrogenase [Spirochaetaceae bacterium]|nr:zinc-binding dehydrogenase [Spirochaetaceae bacterium]